MPFVIGASCIDNMDRACLQECPVDCIYEGERKFYINPDECIDCGACEPVCPVEAIASDVLLPPGFEEFVEDNARFFTAVLPGREQPLGSPGGSRDLGPVGADTALVRRFPVQAPGA